MTREIQIGSRLIGDGHPAYIVAEVGVNHNGSVETAKHLIRQAHHTGVDAVKFQKRTPELCVPEDQCNHCARPPGVISLISSTGARWNLNRQNMPRSTRYCRELGIEWFASVWDEPSVEFLEHSTPSAYKVPSASSDRSQPC